MLPRIDRSRRRVLTHVGAAVLLAVTLFVVGSMETRKALEALTEAGAEAQDMVDYQLSQMEEWTPSTLVENQAWDWLNAQQETLLAQPDSRLSVPAVLTRLADREGLHSVSLEEISRLELEWAVLEIDQSAQINRRPRFEEEEDEDYEDYDEYDDSEGEGEELLVSEPLVEHGFKMRFEGRYEAFMRFLKDLDSIPHLVVMRKALIQRGVPDLTAELILVAYEETP